MILLYVGPVPPSGLEERLAAETASSPRRVVEVTDYLVVTTHDHGGATPAGFEGPMRLPKGIRIERLDPRLAERLLRAAQLRGENWDPTPQFHAVHAYVRTIWSEGMESPTRSTAGITNVGYTPVFNSPG
jgi:hypothetical protein